MDQSSNDTTWLASPSSQVRNDAHRCRVSALAKEIARFFATQHDPKLIESLAWLHNCPADLLPDSGPTRTAYCNSAKFRTCSPGEEIAEGIRSLRGTRISDEGLALTGEIVSLANSLDEMLEWRQFEQQTMEDIFKELSEMNQLCLWRPEILAALCLVSGDFLQKAVAADRLPVSGLAVVRTLATIPIELLTPETLYRAVSSDPALAGDLLRVVNTWGHPVLRGRVSTIETAIWHLGTEETRNVLIAAASRTLFASNVVHGLWKHSVRVAEIAANLGSKCGYDPEEAFLAGLLHDVGRLAMEKLDRPTLEARSRLAEQDISTVWIDLITCWHDHGEIGGALLEKWSLPLGLVDAVKFHHSPELSDSELTSIIYLAELRSGSNEDLCSPGTLDYALDLTGLALTQVQEAGLEHRRSLPLRLAC